MFTGIVEEIGMVRAVNSTARGTCLKIKTRNIYTDAKAGDSIAINGVCLTIIDIKKDILSFDVIKETIERTALGGLKANEPVNLERSLRADSRISGHFVTGHIDYTGRINEIFKDSRGTGFRISLPSEFFNFVVEKGSAALDGVSLTIAEVDRDGFFVYLIPHTLKVTTLGKKKKGDHINVETDLLAKYLATKIQKASFQDLLKKYEYI